MEAYLLALLSLLNPVLPDPDELYARLDVIADAMNSRMEDRYDALRSYIVDEYSGGFGDRIVEALPEELPRLPFFDDDDEP